MPETIPCPQCSTPTPPDDFDGGVCGSCHETNYRELLTHNLEFDRWAKMTPRERENEIAVALRREG